MKLQILTLFLLGLASSEKLHLIKLVGETLTLCSKPFPPVREYTWKYGQLLPDTLIVNVTNGSVIVPITRFTNRLDVYLENGSITISNLSVNDSGIFLFQSVTQNEFKKNPFILTVLENAIIPLPIMEGDNFTLYPGIKDLLKDDGIIWRQGEACDGAEIVEWKYNVTSFKNESFEGRLELNSHNGALTFTGITKHLAGCYCVKMLQRGHVHLLKIYQITVYKHVSVPHVTVALSNITTQPENDVVCSLSCSVNSSNDVTLSWYKGHEILSQTGNTDATISLTLRLEISNQNGSIYTCTAENPVSSETVTINSAQLCPHHDRGDETRTNIQVWIGIAGAFGLLLLVTGSLCYLILRKLKNSEGLELQQITTNQDSHALEGSGEVMLPNSTRQDYQTFKNNS